MLARELQIVLEYKRWDRFLNAIEKGMTACTNSGYNIVDHFSQAGKMVKTGVSTKEIIDFKLTRYVCCLIAQKANSSKKVALGNVLKFACKIVNGEL